MRIIRVFGARQRLNLGGTVMNISNCYMACNQRPRLNFRDAPVIMKLPLQEARFERNGTHSLAAGSQG